MCQSRFLRSVLRERGGKEWAWEWRTQWWSEAGVHQEVLWPLERVVRISNRQREWLKLSFRSVSSVNFSLSPLSYWWTLFSLPWCACSLNLALHTIFFISYVSCSRIILFFFFLLLTYCPLQALSPPPFWLCVSIFSFLFRTSLSITPCSAHTSIIKLNRCAIRPG